MTSFFNFFGMSDSKISFANLMALPEQTQLLLAYCLVEGNRDLSLMKGDTDADSMISAGWLGKIPTMTSGVVSFKFQPDAWARLNSLRSEFLAKVAATEVQAYAKSKSAQYPWTW